MKKWLNKNDLELKLIFIASQHGFDCDDFHSKCDN